MTEKRDRPAGADTDKPLADAVHEYSRTVNQPTGGLRGGYFFYLIDPLKRKADSDLARAGVKKGDVTYIMSADMRYAGESAQLNIKMQSGLEEAFRAEYEREYGHADKDRPVEIVTVRLRVIVRSHNPRRNS